MWRYWQSTIIKKVLEIFPNVHINKNQDELGYFLLHRVVQYQKEENISLLKYLLTLPDVNINILSWTRETPLFNAIRSGNMNCARLLLNNPRVDTNAVNHECFSIIDIARSTLKLDDQPELVEALIKKRQWTNGIFALCGKLEM